ncbi:MAG TPA: hypothetical protein VM307_15200, partial [Egibacteraceae bacterium]|nr:hypothetical protein [Egibacteraceae bacterium]
MPIPDPPYPGLLDEQLAAMAVAAARAEPLRSPHAGAPQAVGASVTSAVERLRGDLVALSHDVHAHPELGYEEHHAVAAVAALLRRHGHEPEVGAYGLPTALRARAGTGRPTVAVLAEYDALPELGHACGHNV